MMTCRELATFLDGLLPHPPGLTDASNNGLQVEGQSSVERVAFGVDACMALFEEAVRWKAHAVVVHHGISWKNGFTRVLGMDAQRLGVLLRNGIALYASHIPLDCHPHLGNNAVLSRMIGIENPEPFGNYGGIPIGFRGRLPSPMTLEELAAMTAAELGAECTVVSASGREHVRTLGIVSGGGGDMVSQCPEANVDCLLTGEITHQNIHPAREARIDLIGAGHYATEVWGLKAVMKELEETGSVQCRFVDLPTGY